MVDESGDARNGDVLATYPAGDGPTDVAVDPVTHDVYIGDDYYPVVLVLDESGDAQTGTIRAISVRSGQGAAEKLVVDPSTHEVYLLGGDGIALIDGSHGASAARLTATVAVVASGGIAVDPSTHAVYVVDRNAAIGVGPRSDDRRGARADRSLQSG